MLNGHGFMISTDSGPSSSSPLRTGDRSMPSTPSGIDSPTSPSRVGMTSMTLSGASTRRDAGTTPG